MNAGLIYSHKFENVLVESVMHHWRNGKDTWQISQLLTTVERSLHIGLERKRNAVVTP